MKPSNNKHKTGEPTPRPSISIKKHLTDNGYPDAHRLKPSIPFNPNNLNTFSDKDGTNYQWKYNNQEDTI